MIWTWLLRCLPTDLRESVAGDLQEERQAIRRRYGRLYASAWLAWTAARLSLRFAWELTLRGRPLPPIRDEVRRRDSMLDPIKKDISFALRMLRRQPGFTAVALIALALGVGANTAIFSIVNTVLWRPLPYPDSDRIMSFAEQRPREARLFGPASPADYFDWRSNSSSFSAMAAYLGTSWNMTGVGEPEQLRGVLVSPGFLRVLGVVPAQGRDFQPEEETRGRHRVVLVTDSMWRNRFAADPGVIGRKLSLDGNDYEIIGILPPG